MANICVYHAIIKGKRNNIMLMAGALPRLDEKELIESYGPNEDCTLLVKGDCKWTMISHQAVNEDLKQIKVPENEDDAYMEGNDYWYTDFNQMANLLDIELHTAEIDIDDPVVLIANSYGPRRTELSDSENEFLSLKDVFEEYDIDPEELLDIDYYGDEEMDEDFDEDE